MLSPALVAVTEQRPGLLDREVPRVRPGHHDSHAYDELDLAQSRLEHVDQPVYLWRRHSYAVDARRDPSFTMWFRTGRTSIRAEPTPICWRSARWKPAFVPAPTRRPTYDVAMSWQVYLSGEIHTDWRERIERGATAEGLDLRFTAPVTDHAASDAAGTAILGEQEGPFWNDHLGAGVNAIRTRTLIERADVVVVRFGEQYRQWNAAFDAGYAAALGKPLIILHPPEHDHALKEVDRAALAVAREPEQVVEILRYASQASQHNYGEPHNQPHSRRHVDRRCRALERRVRRQAHGHRQRARPVHRVRGHPGGRRGSRELQARGSVKVASITTDEEQRDAHLRSADFFNADEYPEITFESTLVEAIDEESSRVIGNLTMHGVTQEVKLKAVVQGTDTDPGATSGSGWRALACSSAATST